MQRSEGRRGGLRRRAPRETLATYEVGPYEDRWIVHRIRGRDPGVIMDELDDAVELGSRLASQRSPAELVVRDRDGQVTGRYMHPSPRHGLATPTPRA
ncbi:MAG: DUF2188 domain-containing protein [Longimicrobiales bacterium]